MVMANVPNLHVLCLRRDTAVSVDTQAPPTSKMDSAQNFGAGDMLELLLLSISWPIMPCDASWWG